MSTTKSGSNGKKKVSANRPKTVKFSEINHRSNPNNRITSGKPTGNPPKSK